MNHKPTPTLAVYCAYAVIVGLFLLYLVATTGCSSPDVNGWYLDPDNVSTFSGHNIDSNETLIGVDMEWKFKKKGLACPHCAH
jgi:hypothetical protein